MSDYSTCAEPDDAKTVRLPMPLASRDGGEASTVQSTGEATSLKSQYEILDRIGSGGMGVVYLARDRRLGRYVAIKRLNATGLSDATMKDRFFHEARAVASLNHIHIVHIYALGEDREGPFIVMEYVAGPTPAARSDSASQALTLADRIHREGPMALDAALQLLIKLCGAIEFAHSCHVIHRDLKPTNILLDESDEPKIVDFGLARMRRRETKPLTLPGEQMLSLGYGAPEQESDASLADERADIYGLGALLYFCITGKNPRYFRQNDLPEVLRMPVVKALETDRDQRWSDVKAFRSALVLTRSPSEAAIPTAKTTWRCKWCDTVNPVAIRYCGKCGWDGGVFCVECASESRFGVPYCGACGADSKAYENVEGVLRSMTEQMERRNLSLVEQQEAQVKGFTPQGANGRKLLDRVHQMADEARTMRRRRDALRNEIKREFDSGSYEQTGACIREYNELALDGAFSEIEGQLEGLQFDRDLGRLRTAVRAGHWLYAKRLGEALVAKRSTPEVVQLLARIGRRLRAKRGLAIAGIMVVGFLLYLSSGAPVYRLSGCPEGGLFSVVYRPLYWAHSKTLFRYPLELHARAYAAESMFDE